jgi:SNF2 family DNA or RNA helicase
MNEILADEMGLGKTVMGVNVVYDLFLMGNRGPFLVIAPLSTLDQWVRVFRRWTPMNVIKYTGDKEFKQMIVQYELYFEQDSLMAKFNVLLTNFDVR